jgi:hypothetical protein
MKTQISKQLTLKLVLLFAIAFVLAMPAMAQTCAPNYCSGTINRLYVPSTTGSPPTVYVSVGTGSPQCTLLSGVYITLPTGTPGYDQMYSLLLQAKITNTPVIVRINNGSNPCTISYVVAGQ